MPPKSKQPLDPNEIVKVRVLYSDFQPAIWIDRRHNGFSSYIRQVPRHLVERWEAAEAEWQAAQDAVETYVKETGQPVIMP